MKTKLFVLFLCLLFVVFSGYNVFAAGVQEEKPKELTILTWNIPFLEETIKGWIADFEAENPGFKVNWIDKKGTDIDAFLMTQLAAGEMPDIIDFQGALYAKYAGMGALAPLSDYVKNDPETKDRFNQGLIDKAFKYEDDLYEVPFYYAPTLLYYNKIMFKEAGITRPPETFDELMSYAQKLTKGEKSGFMTLNFDWIYWPLFHINGVSLLTPDNKKAAFNTPQAVKTLDTLAKLTANGTISRISWTKRWAELNDAFAAGIIGMFNSNSTTYHNVIATGDWINEDTMGIAPFPGGWKVPGQHGLAMSAFTEYPDAAWELIKIITNEKWAIEFAKKTNILTGNVVVDEQYMNLPEVKGNPLHYAVIQTILSNPDKITGHFPLAQEARIKDAFFTSIQGALLGEMSAQDALNKAEIEVNKILAE